MDIFTANDLLAFMQTSGYLLMFLVMIFEGTIITYVAAFLASTGIFNIYLVFGLAVLGNFTGDTIAYFSGKHLGKKYLLKHFNKPKWKKLKQLLAHAKKNPGKVILIIKNSPIIPIPGLMLIGTSGLKTKQFYIYSAPTSVLRALLFTLLGYFSGTAFTAIAKDLGKTNLIIAAGVILGVGIWTLVTFILKKTEKRIEKLEKKLEEE